MPSGPRQTEAGRLEWLALAGAVRRFAKGITEAMNGPDESRIDGGLAERVADFGDQVREILLDDKRTRPQALLEIAFGLRLGRLSTRMPSSRGRPDPSPRSPPARGSRMRRDASRESASSECSCDDVESSVAPGRVARR